MLDNKQYASVCGASGKAHMEIHMRKIIASLLLIMSTCSQAVTVPLPDIYVTKVVNTNNDSGTYTVTINQPPYCICSDLERYIRRTPGEQYWRGRICSSWLRGNS